VAETFAQPPSGSTLDHHENAGYGPSISKYEPPSFTVFTLTASGPTGSSFTISGTNFSTIAAQNTVKLNGINAIVTNATSSQLVVTVPSGATTGPVSVTVGSATVTSSSNFTVTP
jgi:uncharacterized protein (TIGR03437 family)